MVYKFLHGNSPMPGYKFSTAGTNTVNTSSGAIKSKIIPNE